MGAFEGAACADEPELELEHDDVEEPDVADAGSGASK